MNSLLNKGAILLISGPSGCGKSSLLKKLFKAIPNYYFSISTTTRELRNGEEDGVDYFFVTKEEFEQDIKDNNFLEYATVHGNYYGTSLKPIYKALEETKLVIFDIDVQGFEQVIKKLNHITTTVFITTPNLSELKTRLINRKTDSNDVIKHRITNAKKEIKYIDKYDYLVVNDDLLLASTHLIAIAKSAMLKSSLYNHDKIQEIWTSN